MAARYDEFAAAEHLIEIAEGLARDHNATPPGCLVSERRREAAGNRGAVARWADFSADVVAATDASWKDKTHGIGYVVSDGQYGLRGWPMDPLDPTGPSRVLIDELRAVEFLLSGFARRPDRLTVLVDSIGALSYLHRWQAGETTTMPAGYNLRARTRATQPTLVRLAELLPRLPDVSFQHVRGHTGHLLNEAADSLSSMARRRVRERFDVKARAHDLVSAFLRQWHATSVAA
jgi:ribonuclease HI